jgi:membrane protease YdiL (CAAX protease family)
MTLLKSIIWDEKHSRLRAGWRLMIQLVLLIAFLVVFAILDDLLASSLPRSPLGEGDSILLPVEMLLAHLLSVWIAGHFLDRRRFADFGLHFSLSWWFDLTFGLVLGAGLITGIFLIERGTGWATVTEMLWSSTDGSTFPAGILLVLITFLCGGICEEIWTRGYLLRNLAEGLNLRFLGPQGAVVLAACGTAVIFGLGHATNPGATAVSTLALVLAGILYATAYVLTGELAIPIGYHIMWNFFQGAVFGFPVSGYSVDTSFVATRVEGPELWTGGTFGPEAGLLGVLARLVGILLIIAWVQMRYRKTSLKEELATPDLHMHKRV